MPLRKRSSSNKYRSSTLYYVKCTLSPVSSQPSMNIIIESRFTVCTLYVLFYYSDHCHEFILIIIYIKYCNKGGGDRVHFNYNA